ncbi:MAG: hypothetical protein C0621_10375 [Desulfuromonas sp.]|nr:MAG: hypothetical protein C0621_10375 [Desulfuromonas sp.]
MSEIKTHYTSRELATLPGMPTTERGVQLLATRQNWPWRKRAGRGGGREYPVTALPDQTREHLVGTLLLTTRDEIATPAAISSVSAEPPASVAEVQPLAELKTWQQRRMDARLQFIRLIERGACTIGVNKTIDTLVAKAKAGLLPDDLQRLVPVANARSGGDGGRTLSRRTLMRWWSDYKKSGGDYAALAPAKAEREAVPPWAAHFLKLYQVPQKPSLAMVVRDLAVILPEGVEPPSETQVRSFVKKYSRLDIQKGRKSGSELRGQRLFRQRDSSGLEPGDIFVFDGHSFKAYVSHPAHGRPFKPEVCCGIDVATRYVPGFSVGLAESTQTVADAIRACLTVDEKSPVGCIPAIIYADNGGGNTAKVNADDIAGLYARLGITFKTGIPGNPQGRGIVERLNATLWLPAAKRLPTYTGKDMDSLTARGVYLTLQKEVREAKKSGLPVKSDLLIAWADFIALLEDEVNAYNHRPHSALPRIADPGDGRMRHMTPAECWANWVAKGWRPILPETAEIDTLFRPHEQVKCTRGTVRLFGNIYADPALNHYHGMLLTVGYDIHDASRVWVRDEEGRLIVVARRDANKSAWMPVTAMEKAREQRYQNRMRTLERQREEVELERAGAPQEVAFEAIEITPEIERGSEIVARLEAKKKERPMPENDFETAEALQDEISRGLEVSPDEQQWLDDYNHFLTTGKKRGLHRSGWQPYAARLTGRTAAQK